MKKTLFGLVGALLLGGPIAAQAETLLVDYYTLLGPTDAYNSKGQPLNDLCAIVQQDRANWHRFKRRDDADSGDFYFTSAAKRSSIAGKCDYDRGYYYDPGARIRNGSRSFFVYVRVYQNYGSVSRVLISEGAG